MKKNYTFLKNSLFGSAFLCLSLVLSTGVTAQTLNFTIDTAIDNGTSITETLTNGADTYVLTVFHSGNEELASLGGGDLIFFLSAINPLTPYTLSIKKNGEVVLFKLNSIDYDTLGAGIISVTNQDDEEISAPTSYPLGSGNLFISNLSNAFNITEINIKPTTASDLNNFGFHNINIDVLGILGVDENSLLDSQVSIFPNPSNGDITIKNSSIALESAVVTDLNGRTVMTYNLNGIIGNQDLKMNSVLSSGMYFMTISSEKASTVKKIIIN